MPSRDFQHQDERETQGDTVFSIDALLIAWFVLRLSVASRRELVPVADVAVAA